MNPTIVLASVCALFLAVAFAQIVVSAKPNEWLVVISDGEMKKAGVGITSFVSPFDSAVKFPSAIQKVTFKAQQVTKEMQGLEVSGFIVWAVNRVDDGPFRAYKYLDGLTEEGLRKANGNVAHMAESIIRAQVANLSLDEVIRNRDLLRTKVKQDMLQVIQGWGMWLETAEVVDVRVLSQTLFDDLQTEFRQSERQKAHAHKSKAQQSIKEMDLQTESQLARRRLDEENARSVLEAQLRLTARQEDDKVDRQLHAMRLERLEREKELSLKTVENEAEVQAKRISVEIEQRDRLSKAERDLKAKQMELDNQLTDVNLKKLALDTTKEIYSNLPLHDVKLYNTGKGGGLESLLPGLDQLHDILGRESSKP